jgi:uncharacterized protein (DUF433 family)
VRLLLSDQPVPLWTDDGGVIRIANTRVSFDSVVCAYQQGATVEQIYEDFPTLDLADIHFVIAYYLRHPEDVNEYLAQQRDNSEKLRAQIESDPGTQLIRSRLLERRAKRNGNDAASGG